MYEHASKKMKRRLRMMEKHSEKVKAVGSSKGAALAQPDLNWPRMDRLLTMDQIGMDTTGRKLFSFTKTPAYVSLQKEFETVQQTMDINMMA